MKDLPEINLNERKKKRKGFIPWLQARLGLGGRGFMGGSGSGTSLLGRAALGGSRFGAGSGITALLAGKGAFVVGAMVIAASVGTALYLKGPSQPMETATPIASSSKTGEYVPAILREKQNGSSLEMFTETNRGILSMEEKAAQETETQSTDQAAEQTETETAEQPAPEQQTAQENMAKQMVNKLTGSMGAGLSTTMGSGSSKFSGMGGFGNNFKQAAFSKSASMGEVGSNFSMSPEFSKRSKDLLAKKAMAMNIYHKPVYGRAGGAGKDATGKGAFAQAKGIKSAQKSYAGNNGDSARATQDRAWNGSITEGGVAGGGMGVSAGGGSGIVTSPSIDNVGNVGGSSSADDPVEAVSPPLDVSPWQGLPQMAMMLIMMSSVLSMIGAQLIMMSNELAANPDPTGGNAAAAAALKAMGMTMCGIGIGMAGMGTAIGGILSTLHDQSMMGGMYATGGGVATAAGIVAMTGDGQQSASVSPSWMGMIAGGLSMMATMATTVLGTVGSVASTMMNK